MHNRYLTESAQLQFIELEYEGFNDRFLKGLLSLQARPVELITRKRGFAGGDGSLRGEHSKDITCSGYKKARF